MGRLGNHSLRRVETHLGSNEMDAAQAAQLQQMQQGAPRTQEQAQEQADKQKENEEKRQIILNQILTAEAQERLGRIAVVKASFARQVEEMLLQQAMKGQLPGQVDDKALLQILENLNAKGAGGSGPKVQ